MSAVLSRREYTISRTGPGFQITGRVLIDRFFSSLLVADGGIPSGALGLRGSRALRTAEQVHERL